MSTLIRYFEKYALISLEKQEKLSSLIGEHYGVLDLDAGIMRFDRIEFPCQILGTESENTLTYLWAWADEQTEVPERLLASSFQAREWGRKENLEEFVLPSVDLDRSDGRMIALISSEICAASAYYRDPYEGGAVFLLLFGREIDNQPPFGMSSLSRRFTDLAGLYDFNHHTALKSYFEIKNLSFSEEGPLVSARLATGEEMRAEFDEHGRLISINGRDIASGTTP